MLSAEQNRTFPLNHFFPMIRSADHWRIQGGQVPLPPRFFQNHTVFWQFWEENPYFEQILGSGVKTLLGPLTKILDPPLADAPQMQRSCLKVLFRCFCVPCCKTPVDQTKPGRLSASRPHSITNHFTKQPIFWGIHTGDELEFVLNWVDELPSLTGGQHFCISAGRRDKITKTTMTTIVGWLISAALLSTGLLLITWIKFLFYRREQHT